MQFFGRCLCVEEAWYHAQKKTPAYRERDEEKRANYQAIIKQIPSEKLVYLDETGMDLFLSRTHARSKKGTLVYGCVSGKRYRRTSLVAAMSGKKILAPLQYQGTMDSNLFCFWFKTMLLPELDAGSVIIMDNASFHPKTRLQKLAADAGCSLLFLPPYSPDFNPIENFWAWLKQRLRSVLSLFPSFDLALMRCFQLL